MFDEPRQLVLSFDRQEVNETASEQPKPIELDAEQAAEIVRRFKNGTSQTSLLAMFDIERDQLADLLANAMQASPEVEREVLARLDRLGL